MRRTLILAALSVAGLFAAVGSAGANVGDINSVTTAGDLTATPNQLTVEGSVQCGPAVRYGLIVKAVQEGNNAPTGEGDDPAFNENDERFEPAVHERDPVIVNSDEDYDTEGVGAFGPNNPGVNDDQPCGTAADGTPYDLVVERNNGSQTFKSGSVGVLVVMGTTANNGSRGPGPIVGDVEAYYAVSFLEVSGG